MTEMSYRIMVCEERMFGRPVWHVVAKTPGGRVASSKSFMLRTSANKAMIYVAKVMAQMTERELRMIFLGEIDLIQKEFYNDILRTTDGNYIPRP